MQTNKKLVSLMAIVAMCTTVYAQKGEGKVLVAYFSATGTTEDVAEKIAAVTGGELHEIAPEQAYTDADLDWNNRQSRSSVEMNDPKSRPALKEKKANMADYDVIFLGYPNWWYDMPMAMYSFLEEYDLSGKTIIPFAASAGSGFSGTISSIQELEPEAVVMENGLHIPMGDVANGQAEIETWISELGIF